MNIIIRASIESMMYFEHMSVYWFEVHSVTFKIYIITIFKYLNYFTNFPVLNIFFLRNNPSITILKDMIVLFGIGG